MTWRWAGGLRRRWATPIGVVLEKACKAQLALGAGGISYRLFEPAEPVQKRAQFMTRPPIENLRAFYDRELNRCERTGTFTSWA